MNTISKPVRETNATRAMMGDILAELSRAYATAVSLLATRDEAEAVLLKAIDSLDPDDFTQRTLRNAVVRELVDAQISRFAIRPGKQDRRLARLPGNANAKGNLKS